MTKKMVSFFTAIIILVIFTILALAKQNIAYFWPGLLPVFILLMFGLFTKDKK